MKALILAYDFPPLQSAGAQRPYSWYLFLKRNGVEPVIVTRHWNEKERNDKNYSATTLIQETTRETTDYGTIIRVPHTAGIRDKLVLLDQKNRLKWIRKCISYLQSIVRFYFFYFDPSKRIFFSADQFLSGNKCQIIIATGEPFILFRYAFLLHKKHNIPYITDYRDGWTTPLHEPTQRRLNTLSNFLFFHPLERRFISHSKFITAASPSYLEKIAKEFHGIHGEVLLNGYFSGSFSHENNKKCRNEKLTIVYAGRLYPHQPLEKFLQALDSWMTEDQVRNIRLCFIGSHYDSDSRRRISNSQLFDKGFIDIFDTMDYDQYAKFLEKADVLLLLARKKLDWLNVKLFDYLAARRKILMVEGDDGIQDNILRECTAGEICSDKESIIFFFRNCYKEFLASGTVICHTDHYQKYSRENQTRILAEMITSCAE